MTNDKKIFNTHEDVMGLILNSIYPKPKNKDDFEDYLEDIFGEQYEGIKDDWESGFERWLSDLDGDDYIKYANAYGKREYEAGIEFIQANPPEYD